MEEERTVVCTAMRLFTSKVGGIVKGRRIQGRSQIYEGGGGGGGSDMCE